MAKGGRSRRKNVVEEEFSEDEVDAYHRQRLEDVDAGELDSGSEQDSEEEFSEEDKEVFRMEDGEDSDEEEKGDDSDDDSEEERNIERIGKQWGKSRGAFYKQGDSDQEDSDEGDLDAEEEEEALRLQKEQASKVSLDDLGISSKSSKKSNKKSKKKGSKKVTLEREVLSGKSEQGIERVAADAPELMALLAEFQEKTKQLEKFANPIQQRLEQGEIETKEGVSFLESKMQLMLSYCINISFYLLLKAEGESVQDHPVITQLLRCRTIMEKLRPLDAQLKHQLDSLIRQADAPVQNKKKTIGGADDPLAFRPNLDDLDEDSSDDEMQVDSRKSKKSDRYVVPKMAAAPFEEQERLAARQAKDEAKRQRKLRKNKLLADIREEFSSRPVEESAIGAERDDEDLRKEDEERRKYEEENYTRLIETKKDKQRRRKRERLVQQGMMNSMADLEDLHDLENLVHGKKSKDRDGVGALDATRKRTLQQYINDIGTKSSKKRRSGDEDLPIRDPEEEAARRMARQMRTSGDDFDDGLEAHFGGGEKRSKSSKNKVPTFDDDDEEINEFYRSAKKSTKRRKAERAEKYAAPEAYIPEPAAYVEQDEKRNASYKILKNKGLHAHKKKIERNPRVKLRKKFEKKMKGRKGQVREVRTGEMAAYGGEASGVRTNIVRSRKAGKL